jgi:hypothetical protein
MSKPAQLEVRADVLAEKEQRSEGIPYSAFEIGNADTY